jgi:hypothetical protein
MNQLGELAYQIWDVEFGTHSTEEERVANAVGISGYLNANIGQLNTFINTDFHLDESQDKVHPALKYEEKAIFTQLYLKDYMNRQARNILRNAAAVTEPATNSSSTTVTVDGVTDWTELREGDTVIKRSVATSTSRNTSAQIMQKSAVEANLLLKEMIHSYNMYGSVPLQVAGNESAEHDVTYAKQQDPNLAEEIDKIKVQFELLSNAFVTHNEEMQIIINEIKQDIAASNIEGFTKTYDVGYDQDEITIDWSQEFFPAEIPAVLATFKSSDPNDAIIGYRIEGNVSLTGVKFVFTDNPASNNYKLDLAAFIISS